MIRFFKSSYLPQYVSLFILAVLLWMPAFLIPFNGTGSEKSLASPLWPALTDLVGNHDLILALINFSIVFAGAILANHILEINDLIPRNSLIASFFFILLLSQFDFSPFNPGYIVVFVLLVMLVFILGIYKIPEPYVEVFNSGLLIGIASFFYFPSILLLVFVWIIFVIYRLYNWREWIILPIGTINCYILFWVYYFLSDKLEEALLDYSTVFSHDLFPENWFAFSVIGMIVQIVILMLFFWSLLKILVSYRDKVLIVRKRITALIWFLMTMMASFLISGSGYFTHSILILAAMSLLISIGISYVKKFFWPDIFITLLTLIILVKKYMVFLNL
jgi:hypothetical protein